MERIGHPVWVDWAVIATFMIVPFVFLGLATTFGWIQPIRAAIATWSAAVNWESFTVIYLLIDTVSLLVIITTLIRKVDCKNQG